MTKAEKNNTKNFYSVFLSYLPICFIIAFAFLLVIYGTMFRQQRNETQLVADNTLRQIEIILTNYFGKEQTMQAVNDPDSIREDDSGIHNTLLGPMGLDALAYNGYEYKLHILDKGTEKVLGSTLKHKNSSTEVSSLNFFDVEWHLSIVPSEGWVGLKELFQYILLALLCVFLTSYLLAKTHVSSKARDDVLKAAEEANAAKTNFLNNISHDIRTPMNAIVGMVQIAIKNIDDKVRVLDCLSKVELSSDHLLMLINNVLDMNKLETDKFEFPEDPFDMERLIKDCVTVVEPLSLGASVTIHSHIAAIKEFRYLYGSPSHVKQIFINILTNAVKYNKPGGSVDLYCDNRLLDDGRCEYVFVFKDNGIGMSGDFLPKVFIPFMQEDTTARTNYTGSGLGLPIAKMMAEKMGGTISVESIKGVGSTFTVTLPFKINEKKAVEKLPERALVSADISGCSILLVEDNTLNMEIALYGLEEAGADVKCAMNGKEAVDAYMSADEKSPFDVILMDIMMPVMDGYEATEAIRNSGRADAKTIPIIALTANAFAEDIHKCEKAGMNAHLSKPLNINVMIKKIAEFRSNK